MDTTSGLTPLPEELARFVAMLSDTPALRSYWDFDKRECDLKRLKNDLGVLSHGEAIMAKFYVSVWTGENSLGFDLVDAAKTLDEPQMFVITRWTSDPFFP